MSTRALPSDVASWLESFSQAVRERDLAAGNALFANDVCAFGTVIRLAAGRTALADGQWSVVWPKTKGFRFEDGTSQCALSDDGKIAIVTALWCSHRVSDGARREGRATLVLTHNASDKWLATHTHFSVTPIDDGAL